MSTQHSQQVHFSSTNNDWLTPPDIIERVIATMGHIDLDPCSEAQGDQSPSPNVPASHYFTKAENGLNQPWLIPDTTLPSKVYMNPPYGRKIGLWVAKLALEYDAGLVQEAIALVPAMTDTAWWQVFNGYLACFVRGRLKFSGHKNAAPFPSAIFYLGNNPDRFIEHFQDIGTIWQAVNTAKNKGIMSWQKPQARPQQAQTQVQAADTRTGQYRWLRFRWSE